MRKEKYREGSGDRGTGRICCQIRRPCGQNMNRMCCVIFLKDWLRKLKLLKTSFFGFLAKLSDLHHHHNISGWIKATFLTQTHFILGCRSKNIFLLNKYWGIWQKKNPQCTLPRFLLGRLGTFANFRSDRIWSLDYIVNNVSVTKTIRLIVTNVTFLDPIGSLVSTLLVS